MTGLVGGVLPTPHTLRDLRPQLRDPRHLQTVATGRCCSGHAAGVIPAASGFPPTRRHVLKWCQAWAPQGHLSEVHSAL